MTVYVCPEKDIVCGDHLANWCAKCPLRERFVNRLSETFATFTPSTNIPEETPGLHKMTAIPYCRDREHNPPTHLFVESGMRYVHYCPTCREKSVIIGQQVSM